MLKEIKYRDVIFRKIIYNKNTVELIYKCNKNEKKLKFKNVKKCRSCSWDFIYWDFIDSDKYKNNDGEIIFFKMINKISENKLLLIDKNYTRIMIWI